MMAAIVAAFWAKVDEQGGVEPPFSAEQAWADAVEEVARPAMTEEARRSAIAAATLLGLSVASIPDSAVRQLADAHLAGLAAYGDLLGSTSFTRAIDSGDITAELVKLLEPDRLSILSERTAQGMTNGVVDMVTTLPSTSQSAQGADAVRVPTGKGWRTMQDDRVRPAHAEMEGVEVEVGGLFMVDGYPCVAPGDPSLPPELRVNCVVGDSHVGGLVTAAMRSRAPEVLWELVTASGKKLTATSNHPVLTRRGWVPIHAVDPVDEVLSTSNTRTVAGSGPDPTDGVTTAEQAFAAVAIVGVDQGMATLVVDLDGDVTDGDVDVHRTHEGLAFDPFLSQQLEELGHLLVPVAHREVRIADHPSAFIRVGHADQGGFVAGADRQTDVLQARHDDAATHSEFGSHGLHGPVLGVETLDVGQVDRPTFLGAAGTTATIEKARGYERLAESELSADVADAGVLVMECDNTGNVVGPFPSELVVLPGFGWDPVVSIRAVPSCGVRHVYNFSTPAGLYCADGIVVHNCRCYCVPSGFEAAEWTAGMAEITDEVVCDESGCTLGDGSTLGDVAEFSMRRFVLPTQNDYSDSVMVCLRCDDPDALVVDGGCTPEEMHCTLAYLGKTDGVDPEVVAALVEAMAARGPFEAEVSTVATFEANPDRPLIALIDGPGIAEFRTDLIRALDDAGFPQQSEHGFTAHVSLGFDATPEEEAAACDRLAGVPVRFATLELSYGQDCYAYPLSVEDTMRATRFAITEPGTLVQVPDGDYGQVTSLHTDGTHRTREETDIEASESEPVALVRLWRAEDGEWEPTDEEWAYRVSDLLEVEELPVPDEEGDGEDGAEIEEVEDDVPGELPPAMNKNRVQPRLSAQANAARAAAGEYDWEMIACPLDTWSGDGRMLRAEGASWRDLPLSLMFMFRNPDAGGEGHDAAVAAGSIWGMDVDGDQVVASGFFDSGEWGQELARMISEGTVRGVSVDLALADWEEVVDPDTGQCGYVFTNWCVMAATACPMPAFAEASMWLVEGDTATPTDMAQLSARARTIAASGGPRTPLLVRMTFGATWNLSESGAIAASGGAPAEPVFAVIGDIDLPFADREHEWDGDAARQRVEAWATDGDAIDFERFARAYLWRADDSDPETVGAYSLGFADVIDGELRAIPRGIFAVAGVLSGARGGADIPADDQERLRGRVSGLYARMAEHFEDDAIVAPWDADEAVAASAGEVTVIGSVPVVPPREWFRQQSYREVTPWQIDDDGRVHGHLIDFETYYNGAAFRGRRQRGPRCALGFAKFYGRPGTKVDDGSVISTGTIVIHSEHAPLSFDGDRVRDFHAHTGYGIIDLCVYEDEFGLQGQGALRPNVAPWQVRVARGSQISPHWCPMDNGRGHYLSALVAVNTGAIPLTRRNAIAASALDYCDAIAASAGLPAGTFQPVPAEEVRSAFVGGAPGGMVGVDRRSTLEARVARLEAAEAERRAEALLAAYQGSRTAQALDERAERALAALRQGRADS